MCRRLVQSRVPKIAGWAVLLFTFGAESAYAQSDGLRFITTPVTTATVGEPYVYDVAATNSRTGDPKITAPNGLPPWLKLASKSKGRATLSGTPTQPNVWTITLRAEDSSCSFLVVLCPVQVFDITVSAVSNAPPVVVPPGIPDQSVTENQNLSINVASAFRDPDSDPLTFSATGLPAGWSLSGSVISGVATASAAAGSPYTVTVTAVDGRGGNVSDSFVLAVVRLGGGADVFLSGITATPSPVARGGAVDWVVTVGNSGPSPSGSVALTVEFAGNPFTFTSNPCTLTVAVDRQRLACTVGPIASGATQAVTFKGSASQPGDVYVTATVAVSATVPADPNANNNASAASLNVGETLVTEAAQSLTIGAAGIGSGDLDRDGFSDLALVASGKPPSVLLDIENPTTLNAALLEPGDVRRGLASLSLSYGAAAAGADVVLADVDNDGDLDVAVANGPGLSSWVLRNDGDAVLNELATLGPAASDDRAVAVADMNGDGFADIVIASASGNSLYLNQNGTAFAQSALPASGAAGATDVAVTDVVGSSLPDLVLVYANGPTVLHENLGGLFGAAVTIDAGPASSVASADFNRDGRADLVLARAAAGPSGLPSNPVYINNGSGGFVPAGALGASATTAVVTGDLDGDGASDVVAINASGAHQVFVGDGNGNFRLHPQLLVSRGATRVAIASISRLRRADIVTAGPDAIRVFFNDGHNNFGLGDTTRPVIQLNGVPEVSFEAGTTYADQGATASDDVDGALTPTVTNPVNPAVIGSYTITYAAMDSAGNAAVPVTRIVRVNARAAEGGGGGAAEISFLVLLLFALVIERARRSREQIVRGASMLVLTSGPGSLGKRRVSIIAAAVLLGGALASARAGASDLSYTFVDFGAMKLDSSLAGTKLPIAVQRVDVVSDQGTGLSAAGSLAVGRRFYVSGGYDSVLVDVHAVVTSPLAVAMTSGHFDLTTSRLAVGYVHPIGETLDVFAELSYSDVAYDFGSFAGENFDVDGGGSGIGVGLRWNPTPSLELFAVARVSSVGEVNLTTATLDSGTEASVGLRYHFLEDLGLGFDLRGGDVDSLTVSMRFGFGDLHAGSR